MNKNYNNCNNCNNYNSKCRLNYLLNIYLCSDCFNLNKYIKISKTKALNTYLLKIDDLQNCKSYLGKTKYGDTTYYMEDDVINVACNKYNTNVDNIINVINEIKDNKNKIKNDKKKIKTESKKNKLINKLHEAGIEFRDESILCHTYIYENSKYTLDEIVERMCQMKYLYEYCNYNKYKNDAYKQYLEDKKYGHVDYRVSDLAEMNALNAHSNGIYPNIFPWQNN